MPLPDLTAACPAPMAPRDPRRALDRRRQAVDLRPNNDAVRIDQSGACAALHHDRLVALAVSRSAVS